MEDRPPAEPPPDLHRTLQRQLRTLDADPATPPDERTWLRLLQVVSRAYAESEEARYSIERALEVSSREMYDLHTTLERQARPDPLTGLANRSGAALALDRLVGPGRAGGVGLIYIDLDGFKSINDQHGHDAGDAVLIAVAQRLNHRLRGTDVVARLGGDEFVVIGPAVRTDQLVIIAERLLDDLRAEIVVGDNRFSIGASLGVAFSAADRTTADHLLTRADRAMYLAKSAGKSRVVVSA